MASARKGTSGGGERISMAVLRNSDSVTGIRFVPLHPPNAPRAFGSASACFAPMSSLLTSMAKAAADYGATLLISNHSEFDDAYFKAHTAANRKPGEPNPFDVGTNGVARYFTTVQACTAAAKLRATAQ